MASPKRNGYTVASPWRLDLAGGYDASERFLLLSGDSFDGAIPFGEHRMNRKAKLFAVVAIVALAAEFVLGQDKYSDAQRRIAPYVSIATLDVEKVFEKSQKHNAAMAPIKARRQPVYSPSVKNNEAVYSDEAKAYAETYHRMNDIVTRICKTKNIGLVIRAKLDSIDARDRQKQLRQFNRLVVYSDVPDLTDEVIAELDR